MASVYILYSSSHDSYYIGFTTELAEVRIDRHNNDYYENKYTRSGKPWALFLEIKCSTDDQAKSIEKHIKSMKSKKYIHDLKIYPEMIEKLLARFADS